MRFLYTTLEKLLGYSILICIFSVYTENIYTLRISMQNQVVKLLIYDFYFFNTPTLTQKE